MNNTHYKTLNFGAKNNYELLQEIVGLKEEAVKYLRERTHNSLAELNRLTFADLIKIRGIGVITAEKILKALEFNKRVQISEVVKRKQIKSSHDGYDFFKPLIGSLKYEEFWALYLSRSNKIMKSERISQGGVAGTVADIKIIFSGALECLASNIIVAHNHPSGNLRPSEADKALTKKVYQAGKIIDVDVLDHLIVTNTGYFSFADEGMLS